MELSFQDKYLNYKQTRFLVIPEVELKLDSTQQQKR